MVDSRPNIQQPEQRWIRVFGIPLHAWSENTFKSIGDRCGGYIGADEDTKKRTHFFWARICVKISEFAIPGKFELKVEDGIFEIAIINDGHTSTAIAGKETVVQVIDQVSVPKPTPALSPTKIVADQPTTRHMPQHVRPLEGILKSQPGPSNTKPLHKPHFVDRAYYKKGPIRRKGKKQGKGKKKMEWRKTGPAQSLCFSPTLSCYMASSPQAPSIQTEMEQTQELITGASEETSHEADDEVDQSQCMSISSLPHLKLASTLVGRVILENLRIRQCT
uniref:DUF4283 domain-containing protein n=1 Tax=Nicotiana tabacum TaxID=4097 RepID=A0A1S4DP72_TOBAC|nr:PREDICTED: uncharacterized protein LOC107831951 [Nicotiana tabacum]